MAIIKKLYGEFILSYLRMAGYSTIFWLYTLPVLYFTTRQEGWTLLHLKFTKYLPPLI